VLSCLAGGAIAAAPITASAAAHHGPAKKHHPKVSHAHGLYVATRTGASTKVEHYGTSSAFVRAPNGDEHVVTTKANAGNANRGHLVYLTRHASASKWNSHAIPGTRALNGGVQIEAHLSQDGRRVFAVIYECDGVFVTDATAGAARLPEPTQVVSEDQCADPTTSRSNPPVQLAGNLFSATIGILLPDPAQDGVDAIFSGTPTGGFTPGVAVPTTDSFQPVMAAIDPDFGNIVVVGTGSDGVHQGIYEVSQRRFADSWSGPTLVASMNSATTDYRVEAVQTYARHVYIGLSRPVAQGTHPAHTLFLVRGQPSGQWLGAVPLPHSNSHDRDLRLAVNTATRHVHAVWTRVVASSRSKKSGLIHTAQGKSGWLKPVQLTHWYRDVATQISLDQNGHPYVGYNQ
jgi:hypothetical protein